MSKVISFLALLFLTACSGAAFPARVSAFGTVAASPRSGQPQASPVASGTLAPTDAGTATPDLHGTDIAAHATSQANELAQAQLSASQTSESVQATQAAYMLNLTADAESRAAGATQQANRLQADSLSATRTQDGAVMAARAPTIIAAMTQAQYTQAHEVAGITFQIFGGIGLALLGLAFVIAVIRLIPAREAAAQVEPETQNEALLPAVTQVNKQSGGYLSADQYEWHFDRNRIAAFWQGVAAGRSISFGRWTPAANGFSYDEFIIMVDDLRKFRLAKDVDPQQPLRGMVLTPTGEALRDKYAQQPPAPSGLTPIPGV